MRPIYTAPTIEAAERALDRFDQAWAARYPASVAAWRNHWHELTTFFRYLVELRRIIYTTNAIESLHSQMRKNITNRWTRRQGWDISHKSVACFVRRSSQV